MPRPKKFNSKKKNNKQNALKATEARVFKKAAKAIKNSDLVVPTTKIDYAVRYLQRLILEIVSRADALEKKEAPKNSTDGVCVHPATVGSSQFKKLLQPGSITLKQLHGRVYNAQARMLGRMWEVKFQNETIHEYWNGNMKILKDQITCYSLAMPWICATPDFVCEFQDQGCTYPVLIEVKSTQNKKTFQTTLSHNEDQVQVALDCFNIDVGYLVTYLYDEDLEEKEFKVQKIIRKRILELKKDQILECYAKFLHNIVKEVYGVAPPYKEIYYKVVELYNPNPRPNINIEEIPIAPVRSKCYFHKGYSGKKTVPGRRQEDKTFHFFGTKLNEGEEEEGKEGKEANSPPSRQRRRVSKR